LEQHSYATTVTRSLEVRLEKALQRTGGALVFLNGGANMRAASTTKKPALAREAIKELTTNRLQGPLYLVAEVSTGLGA
jgi:hypothetical protein